MPLYEYRCEECSQVSEVLQRLGEGAEGLSCPACGSERLDRKLSTFAGRSSAGGGRSEPTSCSGPT